jgi:hypothetical protein
MLIRRQLCSQALVRSIGQRRRPSGSGVFARRLRPRQTSVEPGGAGSPGRLRLLIRGSIARARSASRSASPS